MLTMLGSGIVMTDHPAWVSSPEGAARVFAHPDGTGWLVTATASGAHARRVGEPSQPLRSTVVDADGIPTAVPDLAVALASLGTVERIAAGCLWEAIATAIIRQVIRAGQATKLYRRFADLHGPMVGPLHSFPTPETVLALTADQYTAAGMAFKRPALRAAAAAYLEHGHRWVTLPAPALTVELQTVPYIGAWTAGAAVADWSNNFAVYPYADLAVRTWANRAAPEHGWPGDEPTFAAEWRRLAGDRVSALTILTLAWGKHHGNSP